MVDGPYLLGHDEAVVPQSVDIVMKDRHMVGHPTSPDRERTDQRQIGDTTELLAVDDDHRTCATQLRAARSETAEVGDVEVARPHATDRSAAICGASSIMSGGVG